VTTAPKHYRSFVSDSARWNEFVFRPGDIIISTPPKCGTTWTQMICALLIFQKPEFDRPLAKITPWLDMQTRDLAEVFAELDAQEHRRFIKTHTPLDGLPQHDDITYIAVGRDPRDVGISMDNHMLNMNIEAFIGERANAVGLDDLAEFFPDGLPERSEIFEERFWQWVDDDAPAERAVSSLLSTLAQLDVAWQRRARDNVVVIHFNDLKRDRESQMRALADRLDIDVAEDRWPVLVDAAGFEYMRAHSDRIVPNSTQDFWQSNDNFFRSGKNGQWRDFFDEAARKRYDARVGDLASAELAAWAHQGS
jgi:hypothetical protein